MRHPLFLGSLLCAVLTRTRVLLKYQAVFAHLALYRVAPLKSRLFQRMFYHHKLQLILHEWQLLPVKVKSNFQRQHGYHRERIPFFNLII